MSGKVEKKGGSEAVLVVERLKECSKEAPNASGLLHT